MLTSYLKDPQTITLYLRDPVGPLLNEFIAWLERRGYQYGSVRRFIRGANRFSIWAEKAGLKLGQLDADAAQAFGRSLQAKHQLKYRCGNTSLIWIGARHFVDFLQATHRVSAPMAPPPLPEPAFWVDFERWLHDQRGISKETIHCYRPVILDLLHTLGDPPARYSAEAIRGFFSARASGRGVATAQRVANALCLFIRFLSANGYCSSALTNAIPKLARWRLASLPKYLPPETIERVLASVDPTSQRGSRDRTVLLLLARLALRAGDVSALTFDAIIGRVARSP